jgi:hypothetical protein
MPRAVAQADLWVLTLARSLEPMAFTGSPHFLCMQRPHHVLSRLTVPLEDVSRAVKRSPLPTRDVHRMHAIFGCQLRQCALALLGFQRHAGLEPRIMVPAFLHILISRLLEINRRQIATSVTFQFLGEAQFYWSTRNNFAAPCVTEKSTTVMME